MSTASYETVETANWVPIGRRHARSITARKSRQYPNLKTALHERASFLRGLALWRAVQAHHLMALRLFEGAQ